MFVFQEMINGRWKNLLESIECDTLSEAEEILANSAKEFGSPMFDRGKGRILFVKREGAE